MPIIIREDRGVYMKQTRKLLKICSILNLIAGLLLINLTMYGFFFIIIGFILFVLKEEEDEFLRHYKKIIFLLAIIILPFNYLTSIMLFIAISHIELKTKNIDSNAPPIKKEINNQENRNLDFLLKLGIGMVLISGIIFATTSWNIINNNIKIFILLILGILFLVLSLFSEEKIKIYKTTYMYWLLSMSFFIFTIISVLNLGIFSNYLTYKGLGKYLSYAITFATLSGLSYATYLKFPKKYLIYIAYSSITLFLYNLLIYIGISKMLTILVFSILITITNFFTKKESTLSKYIKLLSYLSITSLISFFNESNEILTLITGIVNIFNLYALITLDSDSDTNFLNIIISYIILFIIIYNLNVVIEIKNILTVIILSINIILLKLNTIKNKSLINISYIFYTLSTIIIYLIQKDSSFDKIGLLLSTVYLLTTIVSASKIKKYQEISPAKYLEPLAILIFTYELKSLTFLEQIFPINNIFILPTIVYCFMNLLSKKEVHQNIYFKSIIIGYFLSYFSNITALDKVISILLLAPSIYIFYTISKKEKVNNSQLVISYLILLNGINHFLVDTNIFEISTILSSIIIIWLLLAIIFISENDLIKKVTYFVLVLPLLKIINALELYSNIKLIISNICMLYITFLLVKFFCKTKETKNVLGIICILISLSFIFQENDILISIYIGIIGLLITFLGINYKNFSPFFQLGIIITILNIINQLKLLWGIIPFWLYLLIGGLSIIIFVTIKELKKTK